MPFQLLREQVEVRYTTTTVEVFFKGQRVSSHRRRYDGQPSTVPEHMPSAHRAHAEWSPSRLIRWAETVGSATGELVARILESRPHPEQGYKAVLGLMRLGRQHGNARLDAASARAMALGSCRFHTVKNILATGQDRPAPGAAGGDGPDAHARQHPRRQLLRRDQRGGPMLIEQTLDKLNAMKLGAMADACQQQIQTDGAASLSFEERFGPAR